MKIFAVLFLALIFKSAAFADINLKITCKVTEQYEQGGNEYTVEHKQSLPNHVTAGEPLKLEIYGAKIAVDTNLAARKDNAACVYKSTSICMTAGYTKLCKENEVKFYPDGGQVGEDTTVNCTVAGDVVSRCKFE